VPGGQSATASFESLEKAPDAAVPSTAPALFAAANRARVSGQSERAVALYLRLENDFPDSSEALTARLSLGLLLLNAGRPEAALTEFRAYASRGRGTTLAEAYWGQALALRALGRVPEERAVLEKLNREFPDSAYSTPSEKRLRELDSR
jgi:tetratricopeptide (TPR) repeat protein